MRILLDRLLKVLEFGVDALFVLLELLLSINGHQDVAVLLCEVVLDVLGNQVEVL